MAVETQSDRPKRAYWGISPSELRKIAAFVEGHNLVMGLQRDTYYTIHFEVTEKKFDTKDGAVQIVEEKKDYLS